jgi:dTDP-4-dehydrorhamnose reductase
MIVVFGAGLLGHIFESINYEKEIIVLSKVDCDITNKHDVEKVFKEYSPEVVINAAGIVPKNEVSIQEMYRVNAIAPHIIKDAANTF